MAERMMWEAVNVFDEPIETCSENPKTGFFRDGCCNTSDSDVGSHTVCVELTDDFQSILVTFDTNTIGDGAYPDADVVWSDAVRPGTSWSVVGATTELGNDDPAAGAIATYAEGRWFVVVVPSSCCSASSSARAPIVR